MGGKDRVSQLGGFGLFGLECRVFEGGKGRGEGKFVLRPLCKYVVEGVSRQREADPRSENETG